MHMPNATADYTVKRGRVCSLVSSSPFSILTKQPLLSRASVALITDAHEPYIVYEYV
jgi:hypothetical protein